MLRSAVCRSCGATLRETFVDLGASPPSNAYLDRSRLNLPEKTFPLHAFVCHQCFLVQVPQYTSADELFTPDYAYFSSYSDSWLAHARRYVEDAVTRLSLGPDSHIVEVASNDGYLLQYAVARGLRARGIEPAHDAADAARAKGVPTEKFFLGEETAKRFVSRFGTADLVAANNVLAHVPDLHDFVAGLRILIGERGVLTVEFPHLLELMRYTQFDTIYHEHFSYFSLLSLEPVFTRAGLRIFNVERLSTHGGSLRIWARQSDEETGASVQALREEERSFGLDHLETYARFSSDVHDVKRRFLSFLIDAADRGERVAAYGAAAKGNTLLNYCGVREDLIEFVVDRNPHKAGKWMPGSRIPIFEPAVLLERKPDYVMILPWNIKDEVVQQMRAVRGYGGRFVVAIPRLQFVE